MTQEESTGAGAEDVQDNSRLIPIAACEDRSIAKRFPLNSVKTSKYTILTFVPLNLLEQLQKAANTYFLLISLLMLVGRQTGLFTTSVNFSTTLGPLLLMMCASAALAAHDDYKRHVADQRTNRQQARAIRMGGKHGVYLDTSTWQNIAVGDIIVLKGEEDLPADIVPLASSGVDGVCYVSTANLDGETNLKVKFAAPATQDILCAAEPTGGAGEPPLLNQAVDRLASLLSEVKAEAPNKSIHNFTGTIRAHPGLSKEADPSDKASTLAKAQEQPLCGDHILLRGTQLKNTAWCFGVVVYTGRDTRMSKNSSRTPMKLANLERVVNRAMLIVLGTQAILALASDIMFCASEETFEKYWYLYPDESVEDDILLPNWLGYWFTFFILYCNLMPISLYAAMEVCNFCQAYFIGSDLNMYDEEQDCPATVRSTNLCHELGQVAYIFSDKTGTLTQNVMELKRISVAQSIFGETSNENGFSGQKEVEATRRDGGETAAAVDDFLEVLAVSHTVMVGEDSRGNVKFEAESPDEGALVEACRGLGWDFCARSGQNMTVKVSRPGASSPETRSYTVLAVNAFTSARKRMSVVVRGPDGSCLVLVKGADNVMLERAKEPQPVLEEHLGIFAQEGLRTLVLGRRKIGEQEFAQWLKNYEQAQSSMTDRENALAKVAEALESQMDIVGATGIEDKLQVGVEETILRLRFAGIKLWVLTGDKLETARNIGYSTKVLSDEMEVMELNVSNDISAQALRSELKKMHQVAQKAIADPREVALMVTGASLEAVAEQDLRGALLEVTTLCKVVIACRVSPLQKAWMVKLVRTGIAPQPVTLSIGDGANDVPMIQEAQVGVGISGREGRQAVNAADFAIAQFRYLQRLLLIHGRLDYRRMCKFILYSFWKNAVLTLLLFYYTFISGFSGTSMFDGYVWTSFNVILFAPIIATGVFDRDVSDVHALSYPNLYESGRLGLDLNFVRMTEMLASSLVHSLIIFVVMWYAFDSVDTMHANDYYGFGTSVFTWLICAMNYRIVFITTTINWVFIGAVLFSFATFAMFLGIYCRWEWLSPFMYNVDIHMVQDPLFWIGLLAVPSLAIMVDIFKAWLILEFLPDRRGLVLERVTLEDKAAAAAAASASPSPASAASAGSFGGIMPTASPASASGGGASRGSGEGSTATTPKSTNWSSRFAMAARRSSFTFDHPEQGHRRVNFFRHPLAADTSFVDGVAPRQRSATGSPSTSPTSKDLEAAPGSAPAPLLRKPPTNAFSQQSLPYMQNVLNTVRILCLSISIGILLLVLGIFVLDKSSEVKQFSVQYDGEWRQPREAKEHEMIYSPCAANTATPNSCTIQVTVPEDMEPPISVVYEVTPFYQNYYSYQASVIFDQLKGTIVSDTYIDTYCTSESTRVTASGQAIFPCGLVANSVFNDTIEFMEVSMKDDDPRLTWDSDYDRFANPAEYPDDDAYSWIYERYPTVTTKAKGVKNRHFVDWMFPSFFGYVRNTYGFIDDKLSQGQTLTMRINASYPVTSLEAEKRIVLSTRNGLGGRHSTLGWLLIGSGITCFVMALLVVSIRKLCPRTAGKPRFPQVTQGVTQDFDQLGSPTASPSASASPQASPASGGSALGTANTALAPGPLSL